LQAIPDRHTAAPLGLIAMITPLNIAIYALGGFMMFALAIGFFAAPV
jgi:acyl-CoA reductase-like NAD-dependent aldehyde dehydrogenase